MGKYDEIDQYGSIALRVFDALAKRIPIFAGIDLIVENDSIPDVPIDTWVSPTSATLTGFLQEKFSYEGGEIVYIGDDPITIIMISNTSVELPGSAANGRVWFTGGINNAPCEIGAIPSDVVLGNATVVPNVCVFDMVKGNTLDLFIKQTSEDPTSDITIVKGRYTVLAIGSYPQ